MAKMLDHIEQVLRGEVPPPPIARLIGFDLTSVKPGGSGDAIPIEEVTFTYDRVRLTYTTRDDQVVQTTIVNT